MEFTSKSISVAVILLLSCFHSDFGTAIDTITASHPIRDPQTIVSAGNNFKLGFFSPPNSTKRYLGIWYNLKTEIFVWVANRDNPLNDSSGVFTISDDGNLVVLNGQKEVLWSSNLQTSVVNASAQLLDSGNLVLNKSNNGEKIWETFREPSDKLLANMKLTVNVQTGEKVQMISWKSPSDPSNGSFSCGLHISNIPEIFIWNKTQPYWRTGPWNGRIFTGVEGMNSVYLGGFKLEIDDRTGTYYFSFSFSSYPLSYLALNSEGKLLDAHKVDGKEDWILGVAFPRTECDVYNKCGANGICNYKEKPICSCLRGFEPKNKEEWNRGIWTTGCVRRKLVQCERINKTGEVGKADGFLKMPTMKVPDFAELSSALENECRDGCLNNCSCIAYAYDVAIGCLTWREKLTDIQKFTRDGTNLYIRLAHSELDQKDLTVIILVPLLVGIVTIAICTFFSWRWMAKRKAMKPKKKMLQVEKGERCLKESSENIDQADFQDLPMFNFEELMIATSDFDLTNKLGQGGFGTVYRGKLKDGVEIAVKRLSNASGQGLQEFMNEVVLICKLQHRNLVRLLGCCIEREEKMLIYEYMPNKSLDSFLFDPLKQKLLDWKKRFIIIEGISRGLVYLHRDSRLRIIHRDLKTSNILLDKNLNPKISDFGMARIFEGNQDQANTLRVVGTYGYMSPEYAMQGQFSEKSDVFSFGVLLLEIISGRKNTGFYQEEYSLTLLGYAWKLWNENSIVDFIDPVISGPCYELEIIRCIHVGLLCVLELVKDRPNMSTVLSMLSSEIVDLPPPKEPAFTVRQNASDSPSGQQSQKNCSVNNVTVTVIQGR
ncbi:G-type lectin S-receptor-like serine/threonine-protein kinase At1g11300 isoform X1 [Mangifera indica]|uniref:G-type lectin S-receptor-like serine/threonine-protein kinase At1g11300 isoform X1 n=1 Tax=Mangifera indica TaxID=29780 RepID=UPI001CFB006F|nr:G-type lectin S-receptor-like serine/threonine-protein kinase At1g11300 isoform X1 [Mangifera indica]